MQETVKNTNRISIRDVDSARREARNLYGDLDLIGLPGILQTLADSNVTGTLTLTDEELQPVATLIFMSGVVAECQVGFRTGEEAFFQLFEVPACASFAFQGTRGNGTDRASGDSVIDIRSALFEAIRRHDEFQNDRKSVPDHSSLRPTRSRPTRPASEKNGSLVKKVWKQAARGVTPADCEAGLDVDSYRVRKLYAHWLEEGALRWE